MGKVKKIGGKLLGGEKSKKGDASIKKNLSSNKTWWKKRVPLKTKAGEAHVILFKGGEKNAILMVASDPTPAFEFLKKAKEEPTNRPVVSKAGQVASRLIAITKKLYKVKDDKQKNKLIDQQNTAMTEFAQLLEQLGVSTGTEAQAIITRVRQEDFIPFKKGWNMQRILSFEKGDRPEPKIYLDIDYINWHLGKFSERASYLVPKKVLDTWGRDVLGWPDNSQFISSMEEMNAMLKRTKGDIAKIEKELGIPAGRWQGQEFVRIDIPSLSNLHLRLPSGNEDGANEEWLPGGKLPTGQSEAVINNIKKGEYTENEVKDKSSSKIRKEASSNFRGAVHAASSEVKGNIQSAGDKYLSPSEYDAASNPSKPYLGPMFYGSVIERATINKVDKSKYIRTGGPNREDFAGKGKFKDLLFDVTTAKAVPEHLSRPYGKKLIIGTYKRPDNFTIFPEM